jgi:hypothetical protein
MATKTVQSVGSKPRTEASNAVISTSSGGKLQSNSTAGSKPDSLLDAAKGTVSAEGRRVMIAEAAYYISERRGFGAGREIEDWLLAEKQVNALLSGNGPKPAA